MIRGPIAGTFLAVMLVACSVETADDWYAKWGGPYDAYVQVFNETDCSALEARIVAEVDRMDRLDSRDDILGTSSHIQAAYRRMVALACPQAFR